MYLKDLILKQKSSVLKNPSNEKQRYRRANRKVKIKKLIIIYHSRKNQPIRLSKLCFLFKKKCSSDIALSLLKTPEITIPSHQLNRLLIMVEM